MAWQFYFTWTIYSKQLTILDQNMAWHSGNKIICKQNSHGSIRSVVVEKQISQQHEKRHCIDGVGANWLRQSHQYWWETEAKYQECAHCSKFAPT